MNETTVTSNRLPSVEKPWKQFFTEEAWNSDYPRETLYESLMRRGKNLHLADKKAFNYMDKIITYQEFYDQIYNAAAAFEAIGVKSGDVVACASVTIPEMVYAMYGLNKIGATIMTIDPRRSGLEMQEVLRDGKCKVMLLLDLFYDNLEEALNETDLEKIIILSAKDSLPLRLKVLAQIKMPKPHLPDDHSKVMLWKEFAAKGTSDPDASYTAPYGENHVAAITMTGGTTGKPKGVLLSDDGFSAITHSFGLAGQAYRSGVDKFLNIIPSFASYGIVASLHMPIQHGAENVIIPKFEQEKVGHYIKKYKPEHTLMVPAHYETLMQSKEMKNGFDLSFFETAGTGGDTMNLGTETRLNNFLKEHGAKLPLSQGYGMSEVSSAASCFCNGNFKSLSVGYPLLDTTISIFEPGTTNELTYGEEGEICITGPTNMIGYLNNPEETAEVMIEHPDGQVWIHSGDLGYMDEDGFLFIKGRIKRMVTLFNGHKVFPPQIETEISKHGDISSVAVVGVKDFDHAQGEWPVAFAVFADGTQDIPQKTKELWDLCLNVEESSRPVDIVVLDEMPREGMGKIAYRKLAADYNAAEEARRNAKA